jgi:hypothetical protein
MAIIRKKTRRVRRKGSKKRNMYFHEGTHNAIILYQDTDNLEKKEDIYVAEILPPFNKLVENLIFIHGFAKINGSYEDLKNDCVTFLYETLHKFDHTRGTKAFSYFNVVAKNWLIIRSKQKLKSNKRNISIDNQDFLSYSDKSKIENYKIAPSQDYRIMIKESKDNLSKLMKEIRRKLNNENEISCMDAIITLFEKIDELDLLNKRAVFVYLRNLSNLNPKQLSIAMSAIRKHYRVLVKNDDFDIFFK